MTGPGQHRRHSLGKHDTHCNVTTSPHTDFPAFLFSYLECLFPLRPARITMPIRYTVRKSHSQEHEVTMHPTCTMPAWDFFNITLWRWQRFCSKQHISHRKEKCISSNVKYWQICFKIGKYVLKPLLKHTAFWFCFFKRVWNGRNFSSFSSVHGSLCKCR